MRVVVLATLVGLCMSYPMETSKQHNHPSKQHDAGFMSGMDFDGFIQDARLPAMARSADVAEDRQSGGGGAGFNSPGFNIPFTPNFQFNEFSSPFGNGNSFSQFLSGLGGQSGQPGDFVQQTEQRFTRPQIGGAQIGGGQFKRETPKNYQNHQNLKNHQNHQNPSHRYESAQYEQPKSNFKKPESFKRPQPVYTPKKTNDDLPKGNYQQFYSPEVREDTREPVYKVREEPREPVYKVREDTREPYQKIFDDQTRNQELKVESRGSVFEDESFEDFVGKSKNFDQIFDQQETQFPETKFDLNFEPAKYESEEKQEPPKAKVQQTFSPPALIEKFKSPIKHSEPYPFQVPANKQEPYSFQAPITIRKPKESESNKPSNVKPFTNVGEKYNAQNENKFIPSSPSKPKPTPTFEPLPGFTNFKEEPKKASFTNFKSEPKKASFSNFKAQPKKALKQSQATKKPYQYEKKNFREPLKQVSRNSGPHQLIRIKSKKHQKPQPKQLRQNRPSQHQSGFRPIANSGFRNNPNPGKLVIEEVVRRQEPYAPQEVQYDNQQPLITLDSVSGGGKHFKASNNQDSFAINVKASFQPKPEPQRQRVQKRRGLIHLPSLTLPSRSQKRQRSLVMDELPYFESAKITRPSSMDTAFILDTDNLGF